MYLFKENENEEQLIDKNIVQYEEGDDDEDVPNGSSSYEQENIIDSEREQAEEEAVGVITSASPSEEKEPSYSPQQCSPEEDNEPKESDSKWVRMDNGQFYQVKSPTTKEVEEFDKVDDSSSSDGDQIKDRSPGNTNDPKRDLVNPYASVSLEERAEIAQDQDIQDSKEEFARSCRPDSQIFDENKVNFSLVSGQENQDAKY